MTLIVVEDSDEDYYAFCRALGPPPPGMVRCVDGRTALDRISRRGEFAGAARPTLVLLDLNLPGMDGRAVLRALKADARTRMVPIVIFSTSNNPRDVEAAYGSGVAAYFVKPVDYDGFRAAVVAFRAFWLDVACLSST